MDKLRVLPWLSLFLLITIIWPVPGANATTYEILNTPTFSYGGLDQGDLGGNYLGPIAAVNSFIYLQNRYPAIYGNSLVHNDPIGTALILGHPEYMDTQYGSATVPNFYWGKELYIEAQLPGKTVYAGQTVPQTWIDPRLKPPWVTERPSGPSWQFLYNELVKGADVEVLLGLSGLGVYVTLTCFHFDDTHDYGTINSDETAWIKYIDPTTGAERQSTIWNNASGMLETDYAANCIITMAASESPVPLPSTLLLFGSGLIGLWRLGRKISAN